MSKQVQAEPRFRRLLVEGSLPASQCSRSFLDLAEPLLQAGVLEWRRTGAGRRLVVQDRSTLANFVARQYPQPDLVGEEFHRVEGVARFRDSKALSNNTRELVLLRAWEDGSLLCRGQPVPMTRATADHGVFAFALTGDYSLHGSCVLVENPALFFSLERLALQVPMAILVRGCTSTRLLEWLQDQPMPFGALLHMPDYDPVGLSEFIRIESVLGERVSLHVPADLEERFRRFSNPALLHPLRSSDLLRRVRASAHPAVLQVLACIDKYSAGLEQESLLLEC